MTHKQLEILFSNVLKRCPFCGRKPRLVQWRDTKKPNATWVECKCGVMTEVAFHKSVMEAAALVVKIWNRRGGG